MATNNNFTWILDSPVDQKMIATAAPPEDRNGHPQPRMGPDVRDTLDRIEELLAMMTWA